MKNHENLPFESYVTSVVRPIRKTTREERLAFIREAKYNLFKIPSAMVMVDLLTDSGTGAISNQQLAEIINGDEAYAGSASFEKMKSAVRDITGFEYVIPTHQGRAAEHVLANALIKEGDVVPGNTHFDTTKGHIEFRKAEAVDCTIAEARDPKNPHPFKGNVDLDRLESVLKSHPRDRIPFVLVTVTCNSGGGQPVSLANVAGVKALCQKYGVRLFFDIARFAENAYFIKTREDGCFGRTIRDICTEMFSGADGATMSAKKDAITAMGGFLALKDREVYQSCSVFSILFEGYLTYGGMTGGTMAALAQGLYEATEFEYLKTRVGQVRRFGELLKDLGVPIVEPVGGHAVYVDAKAFLPRVPSSRYPAQALAVAAYVEGGIRGVEVGTVLADRDPKTRENRYPAMELVRLAVPRRTYSDNHLAYVAHVFGELLKNRDAIRGLEITWEPPILRHFTCEFKET
jgi:tryptophanase